MTKLNPGMQSTQQARLCLQSLGALQAHEQRREHFHLARVNLLLRPCSRISIKVVCMFSKCDLTASSIRSSLGRRPTGMENNRQAAIFPFPWQFELPSLAGLRVVLASA